MVVVIVILAIALLTVTRLLSQTALQGAYTYDETKAIELAESLAGEIRSKRYDENSPVSGVPPCDGVSGGSACTASASLGLEAGEAASPYTRVNFDDVDDYDGVDEGSGSATGHDLLDVAGNQRSGYQNFRVQIAVSYSGNVAPRSGELTDSKKVQLTITQPNGEALDFTFHVGNY
jgi:MSHA pilin protein MshD